jgi:5-methylcytosine-specific restriction endonuclease McrA
VDRLSLVEGAAASSPSCSSCVTVSSTLQRPLNHTLRAYFRVISFTPWTIYLLHPSPLLLQRTRLLFQCRRPHRRVTVVFVVAPRTGTHSPTPSRRWGTVPVRLRYRGRDHTSVVPTTLNCTLCPRYASRSVYVQFAKKSLCHPTR